MSLKVSTMANRQTRSSRAWRAATSSGSGLVPGGDEVKPSGKLQSPFSSFPPGTAFSSKIRFPRRAKLWGADRADDFFLAFDDPSVIRRGSRERDSSRSIGQTRRDPAALPVSGLHPARFPPSRLMPNSAL